MVASLQRGNPASGGEGYRDLHCQPRQPGDEGIKNMITIKIMTGALEP
jgi:hypothetical protein